MAAGIRRKAGMLQKLDSFSTVYISPDRTLMQRSRECVAELRWRCMDQPGRLNSNRDGVVMSSEKGKENWDRGKD